MAIARPDEAVLDGLMARLSDGDRAAFEPLFRAFHPRALRLARLRLTEADALDAAQSALEKVFMRASEFTPGRPALPWFYAVAANEVHSIVRRLSAQGARHDKSDAALEVKSSDDPEQELARAELSDALAHAIESLDPVSASAIAALLDDADPPLVSSVAQRKRVSRAYARLRHLLGRFQ